jgi:hypothetical protein
MREFLLCEDDRKLLVEPSLVGWTKTTAARFCGVIELSPKIYAYRVLSVCHVSKRRFTSLLSFANPPRSVL